MERVLLRPPQCLTNGAAMAQYCGVAAGEGSMSDILEYCKGREAVRFKPGQIMIDEGSQEGKLLVLIEGQV